jgi:alpha-tubulin suppressor-like RCC1 family protein
VYCWGSNENGELATDTMTDYDPVPRVINAMYSTLSMTTRHACGIRREVERWCWGANENAQAGHAASPRVPLLEAIGGGVFTSIAAGAVHSCGIRDDGTVWCWGGRAGGVRGDDADVLDPDPTATMVLDVRATQIDAGVSGLTCAVTPEHRVYCWGPNEGFRSSEGR